jgi:hypothetical protein
MSPGLKPSWCTVTEISHETGTVEANTLGIQQHAAENCVYLFHDVINWNILRGFKAL